MTSETASHTAGSWRVAETPDDLDVWGEVRDGPFALASVYHEPISGRDPVALAALIAASPDLLKAAKRALATFRAQGVHRDGNNVVAALEDAIALAQSKGA